jgi:hypothetical protein
MPAPYEIKRFTIDPVTRTAIVSPIDCNNVTLQQKDLANDAVIETTSGDVTTRKDLLAGTEQRLTPPDSKGLPGPRYRWPAGATVCQVASVAGTGPIVAEFCQ